MACQGLDIMGTNLSFADYLIYPTTCFYYTYAVIFFALFAIITFLLWNRERELFVKADMMSSMGVSATAILFLALISTLISSTNGIPMLQRDIFLFIVAFWIVISGIWFFKR